MGSNCGCLFRKEPEEPPLPKAPPKKRLNDIKIPDSIDTQECTPRANEKDVVSLQTSIRTYLSRKRQLSTIEEVILLEPSSEEGKCDLLSDFELDQMPDDMLNERVREKLRILGPYEYRLKVAGGEAKGPLGLMTGSVYRGQWKDLRRFGKGLLYSAEGGLMEGYWDGVLHLDGRMILPSGEYYEGGFSHGLKQGFGRFEDASGTIYFDGEWLGDKRHGLGIERTPESVYEGNFKDDQKNGIGLIKWTDGEIYEGEFRDNLIHGVGKYIWSETKWYKGEWQFNKMHGRGIFVNDGNEYDGDFVQDKKHGKGVYKWDGNLYEGDWRDGKMHGMGYLTMKGKRRGLYYFENNRRIGPKIKDKQMEPMRATL